jgi:hypothetical protein
MAANSINPSALIVYVHIPKAAGTTVINFLGQCSHLGLNLHLNDPGLRFSRAQLESLDWISAHLAADRFKHATMWISRKVEFYSAVRNPTSRIVSQLNYSFEQIKQKDYSSHHSAKQIEIDADVLAVNFSDPESIIELLSKHRYHFLNVQAYHILGEDYESISLEESKERIACYKYIAHEKTIHKLYDAFEFYKKPEFSPETKLNMSPPHFDYSIFQHRKLTDFLNVTNRKDVVVYELVRSMHFDVDFRPARPSYLLEEATDQNFHDSDYLSHNTDVAKAVAAGLLQNARVHFDKFGKTEGRRIRVRWPPD